MPSISSVELPASLSGLDEFWGQESLGMRIEALHPEVSTETNHDPDPPAHRTCERPVAVFHSQSVGSFAEYWVEIFALASLKERIGVDRIPQALLEFMVRSGGRTSPDSSIVPG